MWEALEISRVIVNWTEWASRESFMCPASRYSSDVGPWYCLRRLCVAVYFVYREWPSANTMVRMR
jgi:hypothetical protein